MAALIDSDGRKLAYREEGSGPPVVLVHGSPGDGRSWARVTPHLRGRFRLLLPDLPGSGQSDGLADGAAGRAAAKGAAVATLVDSCDVPVVLAGHSYGGNIALQAALKARPGAVERLVLFEPVFFRALQLVGDRTSLDPAAAYFEDYAKRALAGEAGVVRLMIDFWFGDGAWGRMPEQVRGFLGIAAAQNAWDVRSTFNDTLAAADLAAFDRPVEVIYGDRSPEVVHAIGRALLELLPQARMSALEGANHGMLDTHSEAVARRIAT
jgi:pimeloyl-ACP methyl ester carboxylesterase